MDNEIVINKNEKIESKENDCSYFIQNYPTTYSFDAVPESKEFIIDTSYDIYFNTIKFPFILLEWICVVN